MTLRRPPGPAPAAAVAVAALLAAGCTAPLARASLRAELDAVRADLSPPAPSAFGSGVPGVFHVHTRLSHDSPAPLEEVLEGARRTGVRWVCLTDHNRPEVATDQPRGVLGGVLVVPGEEISAWGGSVHAVGASRSIVKRRQRFDEYLEEIRGLGGIAFYGHPTHIDLPMRAGLDGMAAYDLSDDFRGMSVLRALGVLQCVASGDPRTAAEAFTLFVQTRQEAHLAMWDARLAEGPCAGIAETDAHAKFRYLGTTWDPFASLFALVRNHALVAGPDEASLLEALRRGRLHWGFDGAADTAGARFEAFLGDRPAAAMGDAVAPAPGLSLAVHLPAPARVRVLRDGRPWREGRGRVLHFPVDAPGVYRAEADLDLAGEPRPWAFFNPVRVAAPARAAP